MSVEIISAYNQVFGIMAVYLDRAGVLPRAEFAQHLQALSAAATGTEAAILAGLADGLLKGLAPNLTVIDGGKPPPRP